MLNKISTRHVFRAISSHIEPDEESIKLSWQLVKSLVEQSRMDIYLDRSNGTFQLGENIDSIHEVLHDENPSESHIVRLMIEVRPGKVDPPQHDPSGFVEFQTEPAGRVRYNLDSEKGEHFEREILTKICTPIATLVGKTLDYLISVVFAALLAMILLPAYTSKTMHLDPPVRTALITLIPFCIYAFLTHRVLYRLWSNMVPSTFLIGEMKARHERRKKVRAAVFSALAVLSFVLSLIGLWR